MISMIVFPIPLSMNLPISFKDVPIFYEINIKVTYIFFMKNIFPFRTLCSKTPSFRAISCFCGWFVVMAISSPNRLAIVVWAPQRKPDMD